MIGVIFNFEIEMRAFAPTYPNYVTFLFFFEHLIFRCQGGVVLTVYVHNSVDRTKF